MHVQHSLAPVGVHFGEVRVVLLVVLGVVCMRCSEGGPLPEDVKCVERCVVVLLYGSAWCGVWCSKVSVCVHLSVYACIICVCVVGKDHHSHHSKQNNTTSTQNHKM